MLEATLSAPPPAPRRFQYLAERRLKALVAAGALLFLALGWGGLILHLDLRRQSDLDQARRDVMNLSTALAEQVSRLIEGTDQVMRLIQFDAATDPETFDAEAWWKRVTSLDKSASQIAIFDERGDLVSARTPPEPNQARINVSDRPYFRELAERPEAGLIVNRTIRGRIRGAWSLTLARRLNRPDGSFGGVLVVGLDPSYMTARFSALDVGPQGSVALIGLDGYVRARLPETPGMYEVNARAHRNGTGVFASLGKAPHGTYETVSDFDGVRRIFGYRALDGLPLVVVVGKSKASVLAASDEERAMGLPVGGLASLVVIAGALALMRELEQRRRREAQLVETHRALGEAEALFRGVFENATDHLFVHRVAADGTVSLEAINPSAAALVGRPPGEARGLALEDLTPPDRVAPLRARMEEAIRSGEPLGFHEERARAGGGAQRFEVILVPVRVPDGHRIDRVFVSARDITHLREAEERIARSEAQYRLLADHATDMIVRLDLDGRRLYVSPGARSLLGREPEDLVGTRPQDEVHPEDAGRLGAFVARLARGEAETGTSIHRLRRADGSWIWVEGSWSLVRDAERRPVGFVASARDVDARQRAEEALRASEARYRALADTLPQLVWVVGPDGRSTYVNHRFEAYYGSIGPDRAARAAANHPDDAARMAAAWRAAADAGVGYEIEGRLRRHDGAYRWHKLVMVPMREAGAVAGWIGTALDIDDILAARRVIEETGDLLAMAQDAAGAGSFDVDIPGGTVRLSAESARLYGLPGQGAVDLPTWQARILADDRGPVLAEAREAVAARRTLSAEFRVAREDGGVRWLQSIGRAYYDEAGRATRVLGLNLDVTERKAAELALREAKAAADAARLEAERASAAKTDFLAAMSHEIRTPLNAVIGFTDLIARSEDLDPAHRRHAAFAHSAGSALLTVVNDILDFSKVEAGAVELALAPFDPREVVDECASIVAGLAQEKGLSLRVQVDEAVPASLVGDAARLRQILLNLLNNAVKFTPRGTVTVILRHEGAGPGGERLRVSVVDTGIGIPRQEQHRLFERFSQVGGPTSREHGGTGLGLAICKRLVELMGGTIGLSSADGQGATFWFALSLPRASSPTALRGTGPAGGAGRRGARILLVEDVPLNQELARLVLEMGGHDVTVVGDGAAAVRAVEEGAFDLVLMDVQMPGMDGMTATRLIRRLKGPAATVPVIAMTANVLPEEVRGFREAGMNDHVGKPFDRAHLHATIDHWLRAAGEAPARDRAGG